MVTCREEKNFTLRTHKTKGMMWGWEGLIYLRLFVDWRWRGSVALTYQRHGHITREPTVKWRPPCTLGEAAAQLPEKPEEISRCLQRSQKNVHSCFVVSIIRPPAGSGKDLCDTSSLSARPLFTHNPQQSPLHHKDLSSPLTWTVHTPTLWNCERQEIHLEEQLFSPQWSAW